MKCTLKFTQQHRKIHFSNSKFFTLKFQGLEISRFSFSFSLRRSLSVFVNGWVDGRNIIFWKNVETFGCKNFQMLLKFVAFFTTLLNKSEAWRRFQGQAFWKLKKNLKKANLTKQLNFVNSRRTRRRDIRPNDKCPKDRLQLAIIQRANTP